jgi:hypothetical protein
LLQKAQQHTPLPTLGQGVCKHHFSQSPESTLALLVPRLSADDAYRAIAPNDLAVAAHLLDGSSNFHRSFSKIGAARRVNGSATQRMMPPLP